MNPYLDIMSKAKFRDRKTGDEFNPLAFGKASRSGGRKVSASSKVFDKNGEFNASSKEEIVHLMKGLLDGLSDGSYSVEKTASDMALAPENEGIIKEAFADSSSEGFRMLGQGMVNVIKEVIDYEGIIRKVLGPRTVKQGEVVRIDKDAYVKAWVIAQDGQTPESVVEGKYFYPPEFELSAYPMIELMDQFRAQYDIVARIQDKARQGIEYTEDLAGMNLLLAGGAAVNNTTFFTTLNIAALESMRYQIEQHRLICDKFILNRREISDFITTISAAVDPVTQRELFMAGYLGTFLNAQLITTAGTNTYEVLGVGDVVAVTAPEFLGQMPVRVELQSEPTSQAVEGKPRKGWYFWELISQALVNPAGVSLGQRI